ncbi:MAG: MATE family efflux transporter [Bacteroidales bacterium]
MPRGFTSVTGIDRLIFALAWPNIISNLSVPLLGIADMAMMGHMPSPVYIGAVALGSVIFNFIYSGLSFLRMGTTGMTALRFGATDEEGIVGVLRTSLLTAFALGLALILASPLISQIGFSLLGGTPQTRQLALSYFNIRIMAAPAVMLQYVVQGWFIGMQNARFPMYVALIENVLNILLNLFFVLVLGMGSDGVALGTVIARYAGLAAAFFFLKSSFPQYLQSLFTSRSRSKGIPLASFFTLNLNLFVRTLLLIFVLSTFTAWSARQGELILAANSLLLQFFYFFSYFTDGFAHAAESLTGRFKGGTLILRLRIFVSRIMTMGALLALAFTLIYWAAAPFLLRLLTSQAQVYQVACLYLPYIWAVPLVSFAAFIWDGIYIGATAARTLRNVMIPASIGFLIIPPLGHYSNHLLWLAFLLFLLFRSLGLWWAAPRAIFRTNTYA